MDTPSLIFLTFNRDKLPTWQEFYTLPTFNPTWKPETIRAKQDEALARASGGAYTGTMTGQVTSMAVETSDGAANYSTIELIVEELGRFSEPGYHHKRSRSFVLCGVDISQCLKQIAIQAAAARLSFPAWLWLDQGSRTDMLFDPVKATGAVGLTQLLGRLFGTSDDAGLSESPARALRAVCERLLPSLVK